MWTLAWIFCYAIIHLIRVLQVPAYSTETNSFIVTIWYELLVFIFFCTFFVLWTIMDLCVELNIFFVHIQNSPKSSGYSVKNIDRILRYSTVSWRKILILFATKLLPNKASDTSKYFAYLCHWRMVSCPQNLLFFIEIICWLSPLQIFVVVFIESFWNPNTWCRCKANVWKIIIIGKLQERDKFFYAK